MDERHRNVRGAFAVNGARARRRLLDAGHVAVVDDVMTTGSTLAEVKCALLAAGVRQVDLWAVARVSVSSEYESDSATTSTTIDQRPPERRGSANSTWTRRRGYSRSSEVLQHTRASTPTTIASASHCAATPPCGAEVGPSVDRNGRKHQASRARQTSTQRVWQADDPFDGTGRSIGRGICRGTTDVSTYRVD